MWWDFDDEQVMYSPYSKFLFVCPFRDISWSIDNVPPPQLVLSKKSLVCLKFHCWIRRKKGWWWGRWFEEMKDRRKVEWKGRREGGEEGRKEGRKGGVWDDMVYVCLMTRYGGLIFVTYVNWHHVGWHILPLSYHRAVWWLTWSFHGLLDPIETALNTMRTG